MDISIEISGRHAHLCQRDLEKLFGINYKLKKLRDLTLIGEFAAQETLILKNGEQEIGGVRIIGPLREQTQVEVSLTDIFRLKMEPVIRSSGDLNETPGIILIGPNGQVRLEQGVIVAQRHIHLDAKTARDWGLKHGDLVSVETKGKRGLVFHQVLIRVADNYRPCMHLDTDEGNACAITKKGNGKVLLNFQG